MIEQNVQVVRCQDERLWVRLGSQPGCTVCDEGKGCGAGLFTKLISRKPVELELPRNGLSVLPGQMMTLAFPEQVYIKLVLMSYGWPLLAALAGGLAGHSLGSWLQLGLVQLDMSTLFCGLLGGAIVMRQIRKQNGTAEFLNGLQSLVYFPAITPNICNKGGAETSNDDGSSRNSI